VRVVFTEYASELARSVVVARFQSSGGVDVGGEVDGDRGSGVTQPKLMPMFTFEKRN